MSIDSTQQKKKKDKKKQLSFETQLFKIIEKSLNDTINKALDELFKDFN